jgi:hypothetical protein
MDEVDQAYYARRAQEELDLASATADPAMKAFHLNRAAEFATKRERAARASLSASKAISAVQAGRGSKT